MQSGAAGQRVACPFVRGPTHPRVLHGASLFGNVQCRSWWSLRSCGLSGPMAYHIKGAHLVHARTNAHGGNEARKQGKSRDKGQARTRRNKAVCTFRVCDASTLHMPSQWRHPRCGQQWQTLFFFAKLIAQISADSSPAVSAAPSKGAGDGGRKAAKPDAEECANCWSSVPLYLHQQVQILS
jgi:hypothetical protein